MNYLKIITTILQFFTIIIIGILIYYGQSIIIPLGFSIVISITLLPVYRFFKKIRIPETLSILCSILVAFVIIGGIVFLLSAEFSSLLSNKKELESNVANHLQTLGKYIQSKTNYSIAKQTNFFNELINSKQLSTSILSTTASSVSGIFVWLAVVPVYVFLILFYKNLLVRFIFLCTKIEHHNTIEESIYDTEVTVKSYLNGLLLELIIVSFLLWLGLTIFGIKYALLMAVTFGVLNMIPYVGSLIATVLLAFVTLSTSPNFSHTWIALIIMTVVQIIDNNIIMTYLVSSKVKINALITVIAVVIGEALAGVGGMFLAIPAVAVLKLVFDKIDGLKHWGQLLGEDVPKLNPLNNPVMRLRKRFLKSSSSYTENLAKVAK